MNTVSEKVLAELDEAFLPSLIEAISKTSKPMLGKYDTSADASLEAYRKQLVMDKLFEENTFDLPAAMIDSEIANLQQRHDRSFWCGAENFDLSMLPRELFEEQLRSESRWGLF